MKFCISVICGVLCGLGLAFGTGTEATAKDLELSVNQAQLITFATPADTIFVAEPKVATYQVINPKRVLVFGRGPGRTSFMALNEEGAPIYSTSIRVSYDTSLMQAALEREFPSLNLKLTPTAQGVIVSGEVPSAQTAAQVISLLDAFVEAVIMDSSAYTAQGSGGGSSGSSDEDSPSEMPDDDLSGPGTGRGTLGSSHGKIINRLTVTMPTQVMIRVRVAEVSRDISEKLGINWFWGHRVKAFGRTFNFAVADNAVTSAEPQNWDFLTSLGQSLPDFSVLIDALAGENLVSVLAEPNLAATSGETASFLAGGQIPVPEVSENGVGATYKDFGVMLNVTPTVLSENRISLRVRPEVSDVSEAYSMSSSYGTIPGLTVRRAETTIEVASGQSFVIGGLLQSNISNVVSKFPVLGDVPILGALFRSSEFVRGETELVIIVTAYVGQPSGNNLRIPNANIIIPNVFNRLFIGMQPTVTAGPLRPEDLIY